jgi:ubiquinone biosynthesis accessory factor UbiK
MLNTEKLDEISLRIKEMVSNSPLGDVEKNINALLKSAFSKMDLISREEFDVQTEVLANTRQKLVALEAMIKDLEEKIAALKK